MMKQILIALALLGLTALTLSLNSETALSFSTKTVAVCDYGENVYCHDEIVVSCNGDEYVLPKYATTVACEDAVIEVPVITAAVVLNDAWEDPRTKTFKYTMTE